MSWQLAQLNIARRRYALDDANMEDFVDGLDPVNALAESSDGFIWRLQTEAGDATGLVIYDDPSFIVNISVWSSREALLNFVRSEGHMAIMKRRREWFERPDQPYQVFWWVHKHHQPTVEEAEERLNRLRKYGATEHAFSAREYFPPPSSP
jgi:heme-degrading monooxygenase HmoA